MDTHKMPLGLISALSDGALPNADLELALATLRTPAGQQAWNIYHRIGDTLRAEASLDFHDAFRGTLAAKLGLEPAPPASQYLDLINVVSSEMDSDVSQAASSLLDTLHASSLYVPDRDMVRLTARARDALATAKGRGQLAGGHYVDAMKLCATHWKRLHPTIASTGLARQEQAIIAALRSATTPLARRAAAEDAGTLAWLYELSALLGKDVTKRTAPDPVQVNGTRYFACYTGDVLRYLQCGASYNVNQFVRIDMPDSAAPPLIIVGEAKGGGGGYGMVRGPRAFMVSHGVGSGVISQRDKLYPLSRAIYMARANTAAPAGRERMLAGKAIEQAARDGLLFYLTVRGSIDMDKQVISSEIEVFTC